MHESHLRPNLHKAIFISERHIPVDSTPLRVPVIASSSLSQQTGSSGSALHGFLSPSKQMLTSATTSGFQTIIFNTEPVSVAVTLSAHIREVFGSDLCRGSCYPVCCFA
jgi:hypothetical protein